MGAIDLSPWSLSIAALLIVALGGIATWQRLQLTRSLFIAAARSVLQLLLVGLLLKIIFANVNLLWVLLLAVGMLFMASHEVLARQRYRLQSGWSLIISSSSLFVCTFSFVIFTLLVIIGNHPWYQPQYFIPLLGMLLGNTMTGVALSMESLLRGLWQQQAMVQQRLALGHSSKQAVEDIQKDAVRVGFIPTINAMATAGVVSLPGMMTGQILAGAAPTLAVKYQILILFLITVSTGCAILLTLRLLTARLFDERQRLRIDRIKQR
jgi:putative ABC transport system permease protein